MNPADDATDARRIAPALVPADRLAEEVAHKEHLLAMEFVSDEQLSRRIRRIEWSVLGAIVAIVLLLIVETLSR